MTKNMLFGIFAACVIGASVSVAEAATFRVVVLDSTWSFYPAYGNTPKEALQYMFRKFGQEVPLIRLVTTDVRVCKSTHRVRSDATGRIVYGYDKAYVWMTRPGCP